MTQTKLACEVTARASTREKDRVREDEREIMKEGRREIENERD